MHDVMRFIFFLLLGALSDILISAGQPLHAYKLVSLISFHVQEDLSQPKDPLPDRVNGLQKSVSGRVDLTFLRRRHLKEFDGFFVGR